MRWIISLAISSSSSYSPRAIADLAVTEREVSFRDSLQSTDSLETITSPYCFEKCSAILSLPLPIGPSNEMLGGLYAILSLG